MVGENGIFIRIFTIDRDILSKAIRRFYLQKPQFLVKKKHFLPLKRNIILPLTSSTIRKTRMKILLLTCACLILMSCQGNTQQQVSLKTTKDSVSYSLGMDIGKNLKTQKLDVDAAIIAKGMQDYIDSTKLMITPDQSEKVLTAWRMDLMKKQQEEAAVKGEQAKKDGEKFLTENGKKEGVKTTASGLQYKIERLGTGPKPTAEQTVSVDYKGTLLDGTEFDNSYKSGKPAEYPVNGFAPGFAEALQLMSVGSKYTIYIPSELAYGERGAGQVIPPNSTLIFEVELLAIKK